MFINSRQIILIYHILMKADYNGMATSNQGFFPLIISTFVFLNCDEQKSLGFQTKAYVNESYCDLSKKQTNTS